MHCLLRKDNNVAGDARRRYSNIFNVKHVRHVSIMEKTVIVMSRKSREMVEEITVPVLVDFSWTSIMS